MARKITKFRPPRPLNEYRPSTKPIKAPRMVAMMAAGMATLIETFSDWFRSVWASQFFHQFSVQQVNLARLAFALEVVEPVHDHQEHGARQVQDHRPGEHRQDVARELATSPPQWSGGAFRRRLRIDA